MRTLYVRLFACGFVTLLAAGCGGGSSNSGGNSGGTSPTQDSSTVTVTFLGSAQPTAAATQIGTGAWTSATVTSGELSLTIPSTSASAKYAVAYVCPFFSDPPEPFNSEYVIEATIGDGTNYSVSCLPSRPTGTATGSVNATAITGASNVQIYGTYDGRIETSTSVGSASGSFSATLSNGSSDIAAVALDGSSNVLGVKILRSQTVPGAINGGNPITFAASDATTTQSVSETNTSGGQTVDIEYHTANGTAFPLNNGSTTQYAVVPAADAQSGDYYEFTAYVGGVIGSGETVYAETIQTSASAIAASLPIPDSYTFNAPTAATFPSFTFNYTGFPNTTTIGEQVYLIWSPASSSSRNYLSVTATAAYQNGADTVTIPDLTALSGFFATAASNTSMNWVMDEWSGTQQWYTFYAAVPSNSSISFVETAGSYFQP